MVSMSALRTATIKGFSLGLITGSFLTAGAVLLATPAKASPDISPALVQDAIQAEPFICRNLADSPTVSTLMSILVAVSDAASLSPGDTGTVVALAVSDGCPQYIPVLKRFVAIYGQDTSSGQVA